VAIRKLNGGAAMLRMIWALIALWALATGTARAEPGGFSEYDVKAAFLFNFAKFVEWPAAAFRDASEPIVLGVVGDDPFGDTLDRMLAEKKIRGRTLVVKRFETVDSLERCHILFVSRAESAHLDRVLARIHGTPTLTVGDGERFAEVGGMIGFTVERSRVRFDVDLQAARRAGLNPSSELLKVARVVHSVPSPTGGS